MPLDKQYSITKPLRLKGSLDSVSAEAKKLVEDKMDPTGLPVAGAQENSLFGPLINPLMNAGSNLAQQIKDSSTLNAVAEAVPAVYDASKTVGYNAARLIDEEFPKGFDAIEKGAGIVSDAVKATPLGQVVGAVPYVYDKAKAVGAKAKNIYGQLTKPIPR